MRAIVYTRPNNEDCHSLISWMKRKGIDYEERDLGNPVAEVESWRKVWDADGIGVRTVPTTLIGSRKIEGYKIAEILMALGRTDS
ncbi:glutaredoxin family protein [Candidatus Saccharibacteria bacterium]|nr:glutaredoxin family protein [Candidatus Saccharibacteria bacterium]